jgi:hypothetical protein
MKLYEIEHINNPYNENAIMGLELKFTHSIDSADGRKWLAEKQPKDWDHVKRLTHMLFLAWNDENPIEGVVYLGEFVSPKKEDPDQEFYDFFKEFNGYEINNDQKDIHKYYTRFGEGYVNLPRRTGKTIYLSTLAIWLGRQGKNVHYITHNHDKGKWIKKNVSCTKMIYPTTWQPKIGPIDNSNQLTGYRIDFLICDESSLFDFKTWEVMEDYCSVVKTCKQFGAYTSL